MLKLKFKLILLLFFLLLTPKAFAADGIMPDYSRELTGEDKFETFNRRMFNFNSGLNKYALRPLHIVWASIMPKYGMNRIQSAYDNIEFPKKLVSCLLQKDFKGGGRETLRFLTNSTIGLAGMFDPAKRFFKLEPTNEDIEQGLNKRKLKQGPYLVLPVMQSTTLRGVAGRIIETALDPTIYFASPITALVKMGLFVNRTSLLGPLAAFLEKTFADPYDIYKKLYGFERHIRTANLDRKEVIAPHMKGGEMVKNVEFDNKALNSILSEEKSNQAIINQKEDKPVLNDIQAGLNLEKEVTGRLSLEENLQIESLDSAKTLKGKAFQDEKILKQAVENKFSLSPDIVLKDYFPQSPVVDSMRTALFNLPGVDDSIWSELSIWNRAFSNRIKNGKIVLYKERTPLQFRYILQKNQKSPLAIIFPSIGEGVMSHHSVIMAKLFYDAGYSVLIQGSHFHFDFVNSMQKAFRPGLPDVDVKEVCNAMGKIVEFLENKYKRKFERKTLLGTSLGAMMALYVANEESLNKKIGIERFISINPPIELIYALKELDKNNENWKKNPNNIKDKTALTAAKILNLYKTRDESTDFKIETLPFSDYEGKLITGFILRQKLSDLIFTIEKGENTDKKALYEKINTISFEDYARKYLALGKNLDEIAKRASLYSISDYLTSNTNYRIYHTLDDYFINSEQLNKLKNLTGKNTVIISNGGHLGFLYRKEFLDNFKEEIRLKDNLIDPVNRDLALNKGY